MTTQTNYPTALLIDDDAFTRKLIATQLQSMGCKSIICHESGKHALSALEQSTGGIKVILCDLQMPDMDGIEVLRRLGSMGFPGALILISGEDMVTLSMAEKLAHAHGLRVLGSLCKPVQIDQLKALLSKLSPHETTFARPRTLHHFSENELALGIREGQLINHYQPKVSTRTGRVVGVEALVRWQHPEHGLIYPDSFIALAEDSCLIDALTHAVLVGPNGALAHLSQWLNAGLNLHMAVNVSMCSLHDLNFPNVIARLALEAGVTLNHLVLEVTESRLNTDIKSVIDVLTRLRLKRLTLSIDDFGTGYSSLAQLHELPFDEIKIDRQFVHQAHKNRALDSILEASINMGNDLGMTTTGEGVETAEDWLHLQKKGCDIAQGYWIAKPMEATDIPSWIAKWHEQLPTVPGFIDGTHTDRHSM